MVNKFYESFDEIFSLPLNKKILIDDTYLYARIHYNWYHGLGIKIKRNKPSLYKKLKELIHCPFRSGIFEREYTVSQLKYLKKLLELEFIPICFKKTYNDILHEERKQMSSKSKTFKKIQSILYKYENIEYSKKNEQLLLDDLRKYLS